MNKNKQSFAILVRQHFGIFAFLCKKFDRWFRSAENDTTVILKKSEPMDIRIKSCIEDAREAEGLTVIIDVFRASNTIIACLGQGAEYVIPVGSLEKAYRLKEQHPDHLLAGERKSLPPEGFDFGNTPA